MLYKKPLARVAGIILALALAVQIANAQTITGKVVAISDGDTITILEPGNKQTRVRLAQIDAPEKRQDFGAASKDSLSWLVFGKAVTVEVETIDKYGRTVGRVLVGGQDMNLEQVKKGMAWVYRQYAKEAAYFAAEDAAKSAKVGLWSKANPTPPWEFRHSGKSAGVGGSQVDEVPQTSPAQRSAVSDATTSGSCGSKRTCGQMASCAEARHYLNDCGLSKLDKDGDGTPCESLCR